MGDAFCQTCGAPLPSGYTTRKLPETTCDATRYLCAGAYLDDDFSDEAVRELFGEDLRAVAPSFGFDIRLVASHCLSARRRRRFRDVALTVIGTLMFLAASLWVVVVGLFWWLFGWVLGAAFSRRGGLRKAVEGITWKSVLFTVIVGWLAIFLASVWTALLTVVSVVSSLGSGASQASQLPASPGTSAPLIGLAAVFLASPLIAFGGWFTLYAIVLGDLIATRLKLFRNFKRDAFQARPDSPPPGGGRVRRQLDSIAQSQEANVTVYSGFDPFVGGGEAYPGWSFAMSLVPAEGVEQMKPFSEVELIEHVRQRLGDISGSLIDDLSGGQVGSWGQLPGLLVSDHVFVDALALWRERTFLPDDRSRPLMRIEKTEMNSIASSPLGPVRYFLCARVQSWSGEVVAFTFLHFSTHGEELYIQCAKTLLAPVREEYHAVDHWKSLMSARDALRLMVEAAAQTVPTAIAAPRRLFAELFSGLQDDSSPPDAPVDHGARVSVRELGADDVFHNYFQKLDADKHWKIVERYVLGVILDFLKAHGVDIAEFEARQANVLNYGIMQTAQNITVGAQSAGPGSSAVQQNTASAQGGKTESGAPSQPTRPT